MKKRLLAVAEMLVFSCLAVMISCYTYLKQYWLQRADERLGDLPRRWI